MFERLATEGRTTIYRLFDQPYHLIYEVRPGVRPGRVRLDYDGDTVRMILSQLAGSGHLRYFLGRNCMRTSAGAWIPIESGNLAELLADAGYIMAVGPAPLAEDGLPGIMGQVQELEDPRLQVKAYVEALQAAGMLFTCPPSSDWERCFQARSMSIPEVRGILRHPIWPDGEAEGWLDERPGRLPAARVGQHLDVLFSALEMDAPSHCALFSYLFAAFHKCSLVECRPLLIADSVEQQCGKSQAGEAIATLVDEEPHTLTLGKDANEGDEIVAQLALGNRCLAIPNLAHKRNWNNTLLATLCTDVGQSRRLKYGSRATTFYGTLGITSTVLGACTFHRDLITRLWRVALTNTVKARLIPPPQHYAKRHRLQLQAEIMLCHAAAKPYPDDYVVTRFPEFEQAGCAAYAAYSKRSHEEVRDLMLAMERSRNIFRDEVLGSLWVKHPDAFTDQLNWPAIPRSEEWLKDYDGSHAFGYVLKEGVWEKS